MGITPARLSVEPLATEGEATRGPDDTVNEQEIRTARFGQGEMPEMFAALDGGPDVDLNDLFW